MVGLKEKIQQAGLTINDGTTVSGIIPPICGNCICCTPGGIISH
ncbi:MAG: hypothetical protein ABIL02_05540 [candidate division WOR-3 bacterium]